MTGRRLILGNADVRLSYVVSAKESPLYRNSLGDEMVYVESGEAIVETVFGALHARPGDYVLIPMSTTTAGCRRDRNRCARTQSRRTVHIVPPKRYLSSSGSSSSTRRLRARPARPHRAVDRRGTDVEVLVKHRAGERSSAPAWCTPTTRSTSSAGTVACTRTPSTSPTTSPSPDACTSRRRRTRRSRATTSSSANFVPRKVDYHPLSIPVPYYHSNVDSDEIMFYCGGDYEARKGSGIGQGSISIHPGGHAHGPAARAYERSIGVEFFDELAVMVDTFRPLELGEVRWRARTRPTRGPGPDGGRTSDHFSFAGRAVRRRRAVPPGTRRWTPQCPRTSRTSA